MKKSLKPNRSGYLGSQFAAFGLLGVACYMTAAGIALLFLSKDASCRALAAAPLVALPGRCLSEGWFWIVRGLAYGLAGGLVEEPAPALYLAVSGTLAFLTAGLLGLFSRWRGFLTFLALQAVLTGVWAALGYLRHFIG